MSGLIAPSPESPLLPKLNPDAPSNVASLDTSTRLIVGFSSIGHTFTHLFTIIYATAVLYLPGVFGLPYGELLGLSSVGLILYGVAALPAGWLGDRWSQVGMMVVFFVGKRSPFERRVARYQHILGGTEGGDRDHRGQGHDEHHRAGA